MTKPEAWIEWTTDPTITKRERVELADLPRLIAVHSMVAADAKSRGGGCVQVCTVSIHGGCDHD